MENLFQKMGLYDIWTVLFPGTIFLVGGGRALYDFMASLDQILSTTPHAVGKIGLIFQLHIAIPTDIYELLALLVLSYFWGGILHELSSIMKHKWLYKNGEPSARLLDEKAGILNKQEICRLMPLLKTLNNGRDFSESEPDKLKDESKYIFHRMNKHIQEKKKSGDYVKLNIIYNMCMTLCVDFILFSLGIIAFSLEFLIQQKCKVFFYSLMILTMMIVLGMILLSRGKRYYRYWVRNIVFAYEELCGRNDNN